MAEGVLRAAGVAFRVQFLALSIHSAGLRFVSAVTIFDREAAGFLLRVLVVRDTLP
jgi:hypothetical protein